MDPSKELIAIKSSFEGQTKTIVQIPHPFSYQTPQVPKPKIQFTTATQLSPDTNVGYQERFKYLSTIKNQYKNPKFHEARNATNPYEKLGSSVFMNRAAVKIANVDGILNLRYIKGQLHHEPFVTIPTSPNIQPVKNIAHRSLLQYQDKFPLVFCDLAGAPGAFTQYLQWRFPNSRGYGISLKVDIPSLKWSPKFLDLDRFTISFGDPKYGGDGTGNLYTNVDSFSNEVISTETKKVDLVVADGGFDVSKGDEDRQEILSTRLILTEILVALKVLKSGGNFMCKIFDTVTTPMFHLIYLSSLVFKKCWVFKPISSRPANSERYLTLKGFIGTDHGPNSQQTKILEMVIGILTVANNSYTDKTFLHSLVSDIDPKFITWFLEQNKRSIERQIKTGENIIAYFNNQPYPNPKASAPVNLIKAFLLWNIPDSKKI